MKLGSVPLRPLWPGSMPTVIPASGLAAAVGRGLGDGLAVPGSAEVCRAAGEAAASPADPVPLVAGCGPPHAASRQARTAGYAAAGNSRASPRTPRPGTLRGVIPVTG